MKKSLISLFICLLGFLSYSQTNTPQLLWKKCYGGSLTDKAYDIVPLPDGGFVVVGETNSNDGQVSGLHGTNKDGWVARMNAAGDILWQKAMGGSMDDLFQTVLLTSDNNIICLGKAGSTDGDVTGNHALTDDIWAVKMDMSGNVLWKKCFGGTDHDSFSEAIVTSDGDIVILSYTGASNGDISGGGPYNNQWVLKINNQGQIKWQKCYYSDFNSAPNDKGDIIQDSNGDLIAIFFFGGGGGNLHPGGGYFGEHNQENLRLSIVNGSIISSEPIKSGTRSYNALLAKTDQGYMEAVWYGYYNSPTNQGNQQKLQSDVHFQNQISTGSLETPFLVINDGSANTYVSHSSYYASPHGLWGVNDSTFVAVGMLSDLGTGPTGGTYGGIDANIGFGKFTPQGYSYVMDNYGGSGTDNFTSIKPVADNEFLVCGTTNSNDQDVQGNHGGYDFWVVRIRIPGMSNTVKGNIYIDANSNGIRDAGEKLYKKATVTSQAPNFTSISFATTGSFNNAVDSGVYTSTINFQKPYYTPVPLSKQSIFTNPYSKDSFDFAIRPIPGKKDLEAYISVHSLFRPGFENTFGVRYANVGTVTQNGTLKCIIDPQASFISSIPVPSSISGDTISWNFTNLNEADTALVLLTVKLQPSTPLGSNVWLRATVSPVDGDETPINNSTSFTTTVVGSWDPNDISERNAGIFSNQQLLDGEDLTYTIRFQNTGTDTAFRIIVRDTLGSRFNIASLEMLEASHPYRFTIKNNKYCEWIFDNIKLPDSIRNEKLSHGFIVYKIKPSNVVKVGDTLLNSASIYFDYNVPVKTNISQTVIKPASVVLPPVPQVSGLLTDYCSAAGNQKGKINNPPIGSSGYTMQVKLDNTVLAVAADSSFIFAVDNLSTGSHAITVDFTNAGGSRQSVINFTITVAVVPDVNLSATTTTIMNLTTPVVVTGTNATGGGSNPLFTFGKDRGFLSLWQSESNSNLLTLNPGLLTVGDNWIYVRMKSSATCISNSLATDSIKLVRDMSTGITDPDYPGKVINVYPNPFNDRIFVKGLNTGKTYSLQLYNLTGQLLKQVRVSGRSAAEMSFTEGTPGLYILMLMDERRNKKIGSILITRN